ncbi:Sensor protein PhoQ [Methyloligella halotolerans]|uniref:histidine kinase n=1 Tax=Methyloligella halotolerans TaxID=1177755 RepID=A0A1E2RXK1_9HYPH|nr:ATP-binding protein [Methyloligella halotolerans]ODA66828.1 Sensor protein PhoQ [Methyloligella halotolerans]
MRRKSLAYRLFVSAAIWTLVVVPAAAILLISLYRHSVERNFDARLNAYLTGLVASSTAEGGTTPTAPANLGEPLFTIPFSGWYWQIKLFKKGTPPLFVSDSLLDQRLWLPSVLGAEPDENLIYRAYMKGPEGQRLRVLERQIRLEGPNHRPYSYAVAGDAAEIEKDLADFTTMLIAALALLGFGLVVATLFQVRFGLMPLRAVREDLAAIRSGKAERLEGDVPVEIQPLQKELNALIESNREIVERARTHVGNLAHALKTPLSVIGNEARGKRTALAKKVLEQTEIMRTQITHHLDRARMVARTTALGSVTDVPEVLEGLKRALSRIYSEKGMEIVLECPDGMLFQGERQDLEEMTGNLMDNACKWGRDLVQVTVAKDASGEHLVVTVDDDGPGLDATERDRAVQRGQRLDETKPGSGLGLSIVADLAHLYKGEFALEPSPNGGLRAKLTLPAA